MAFSNWHDDGDSKPRPEKRKRSNEPLTYVTTAPNEPVPRMWAEILENEGIHPLVRSRDPLMAAMYVPSNCPCEIFVLDSQAHTAREILANLSEP